jgi:glucans biosynthesis protein C
VNIVPMPAAASTRRVDLDWLRIAAFGLLIGYHVGMLYVPWAFHVKSEYRGGPVLTAAMLALNPWRLSLLFLVSGAATGFMMQRVPRGALALQRVRRLLVPLVFGMLVVVVPQVYFEVVDAGKYSGGFFGFWGRYLRLDQRFGTPIPTWNHLWFVAYLLVYTLIVVALWPSARTAKAGSTSTAAPLAITPTPPPSRTLLAALLLGPWALQWLARMTLFPRFGSNHALVADWYNHALYFGMFAIGLMLVRRPAWWGAVDRLRWPALAMALLGGAVHLTLVVGGQAGAASGEATLWLVRAAREAQAWGAVLAALGFAQRHLNHDHRWRAYLVDAVFAWYIVHQTALIALAMWLKPLRLGGALEATLVIAGTVLACALTAEVARRVGWLRPLFGFRPRESSQA